MLTSLAILHALVDAAAHLKRKCTRKALMNLFHPMIFLQLKMMILSNWSWGLWGGASHENEPGTQVIELNTHASGLSNKKLKYLYPDVRCD